MVDLEGTTTIRSLKKPMVKSELQSFLETRVIEQIKGDSRIKINRYEEIIHLLESTENEVNKIKNSALKARIFAAISSNK